MAQEIEIVCKRNEARSPFLAAFLKLHLPNIEFSSSGVEPTQKNVNNQVARNIAAEWGFEYTIAKVKVTSMEAGARLHLPIDSFVQTELQKILTPEQILSLDLKKISSEVLTPLDPVNCNENEMKFELSKLLGFGVLQLRRLKLSRFPQRIEAIIPRNPSSALQIFAELGEVRNQKKVIVVDASLKASNRKIIQGSNGLMRVPLDSPTPGAIYSPIFEFSEPERLLCSLQWREWLTQLTKVGEVLIVTPPLEDENGRKIHDSHLAAIWATVKNIA